jgi:eukaryotic-like serine/threonine-protein kinase
MAQLPPDPTVAIHPRSGSTSATGGDSAPPEPENGDELQVISAALSSLRPVQLRDAQGEAPTPVVRSAAGRPPVERDPTGRLQFQGEIARGGMGAILKGHDRFLGRDIAVKVLLQEHQDKPDFAQRFIEEAQITGQLQHPGIVPVYELGQFRDLRPFFTMKLVKGKTLAALFAARKDSQDERTKFIGIFVQLCQTLAYAHARGVIHRDLKPSNIMVGAFGEVQVMDWGLAKVLREGGVADEKRAQSRPDVSVIRTQRSASPEPGEGSSAYTQAGSILGTPSYLAPEQARGDVDLVDERADVFGLGAILCELLTGQPPYTGRGAEATRKAQTGKLDEAWIRLDACGADPELVNVAKHCLAVEPWDRPRDAGAVSKELAAYQNSVDQRLRQAELAHAAETARAEEALHTASEAKAKAKAERQARWMTLALAVSVLVAAGVVAAGWRQIELDRMGRASALNARVNAALQQAMRQRGQAQGAAIGNLAPWAAASTAARQAEALLETGVDPALREQVQTLLVEVNVAAAQAEVESHAAERDRQLFDRLVDIRSAKEDDPDGSATDSDYADAFREAGIDVIAMAPADIAARLKSRPRAVAIDLAAFLDDWSQVRRQQRKDEDAARQVTEIAQALDPDPWRQKLREAIALPEKEQLIVLQELAKTAHDDELGPISLDLLGQALMARGDSAAAEKVLRSAQQRHPEDVWANYDLASVLTRLGRRAEAVRYYMAARSLRPETAHQLAHALQDVGEPDEAIRVFQELTRLRPKEGRHLACFGAALRVRGRTAEADAAYDAAIVALREQIERTPKISVLHNSLGIALVGKQQRDEAIAAYRRAHELNPKDSAPRRNLCAALRNKAQGLQDNGQLDEAVAALREALDIDSKDLATHESLAKVLTAQGQLDQTIADYRRALEADSKTPVARFGLPVALRAKGQLAEAIAAYREAIDVDPKLNWLYGRLANVLRDNGQLDDAIAMFRQSIAGNSQTAWVHNSLGLALRAKGQLDDAIVSLRRATEVDPRYPPGHYNLGSALYAKGQVSEAIAAYRRAIDLDPKYVTAHDNLAIALKSQGRLEQTIAEYRKMLEANATSAVARFGLPVVLRANGQLAEAIAAYREAIEFDPKLVWLHYQLGLALRANDQPAEAISVHQRTVELEPRNAAYHNSLGLAFRSNHQLQEAVSAFRKSIELGPKYATAYNNLGWTLPLTGQTEEAIAFCRKAIELSPNTSAYHHSLGFALAANGDVAEAMAAYRESLRLQPNEFASHRDLAGLLLNDGKHLEALPHFEKAVAVRPKEVNRFEAACCAALAAAEKGASGEKLADAEQVRCRKLALEWLRADFTARKNQLSPARSNDPAVVITPLDQWPRDPRLTSIRDPKALEQLPVEEQDECRKLWAEVAAALNSAPAQN